MASLSQRKIRKQQTRQGGVSSINHQAATRRASTRSGRKAAGNDDYDSLVFPPLDEGDYRSFSDATTFGRDSYSHGVVDEANDHQQLDESGLLEGSAAGQERRSSADIGIRGSLSPGSSALYRAPIRSNARPEHRRTLSENIDRRTFHTGQKRESPPPTPPKHDGPAIRIPDELGTMRLQSTFLT
jgi:hypothetical protein